MHAQPGASFPVQSRRGTRGILRSPLARITLAILAIPLVILAQEVAKIVVGIPLALFLRFAFGIGPVGDVPWVRLLLSVAAAAGALLAYAAFVRLVERRPVLELSPRGAAREFGGGFLVAFGLVVATLGILWLAGAYRVEGMNGLGTVPVVLASALLAASWEEVVFRGILFRVAEEYVGTWLALAATAVLFGMLHLFSENSSLAGAVGIVLAAGILLAAAYVLTRRLWLALGIHAGYNFLTGLSAPSLGDATVPLLRGRLEGPGWLSGDGLLDASVVLIAISLALGAYFLARARREGRVIPTVWGRPESRRWEGKGAACFPIETAPTRDTVAKVSRW